MKSSSFSFLYIWWLSKEPFGSKIHFFPNLLGGSVLGDGLGAFADGVLGQFTGQKESDRGLDLTAGDGRLLIVVSQAGSFAGDTLKDIVDETVHDAHGTAGDTSVRMHLLQHLVDVDTVAFLSASTSLTSSTWWTALGLTCFLRTLSACFGRHDYFFRA